MKRNKHLNKSDTLNQRFVTEMPFTLMHQNFFSKLLQTS